MPDRWPSKLFFDLQHGSNPASGYRANISAVIDRYPVKPNIRAKLLRS